MLRWKSPSNPFLGGVIPPFRGRGPSAARTEGEALGRSGARISLALLWMMLVLGLVLIGCGPEKPKASAPVARPKVIATTSILADVVKSLGGAQVEVETLMPAGVDPHLYKPTAGDASKISEAKLVLSHGLELEGRMGDILGNLPATTKSLVVGDTLPKERLRPIPGQANKYDPHVWLDVSLWMLIIDPIVASLSEVVPEGKTTFELNAKNLKADLTRLHGVVQKQIEQIPAANRVLVTAHDSFGYFGRAYGLEVKAIQGVSTAAEAGVQRMQELSQFLTDRKVPAIFTESSIPPANIKALKEATSAKGWTVREAGPLFSDSLGDEKSGAATYFDMMVANATAISLALR